MTITTKRDYMRTVAQRYIKASRKEKSEILCEITANVPMHRKSAIRLVNAAFYEHKKRSPRPKTFIYTKKTIWIVAELWKLLDYAYGEILKAAIPAWLPFLKQRFPIDAHTEEQLLKISPSTIDRRLSEKKKRIKQSIFGTTKPNYILRAQIPIRTSSLKIDKPGSLELDTVAHCGNRNAGEYISTVNGVDIDLTWVVRRSVMGKSRFVVQKAIDEMRAELPFPLVDIDFDNGEEFLNHHLIDYCNRTSLGFTRSRPYKKNDQAHIEQKNSTHVRRIFGRVRLDKQEVCDAMNDLYRHELNWYQNLFKPSQKLLSKKFIGSHMKRKLDKPKTPYQRLLESPHIPKATKDAYTKLFNSLDPIELKQTLDRKIKHIFALQTQPITEVKAS
jgi:hypothetical protein